LCVCGWLRRGIMNGRLCVVLRYSLSLFCCCCCYRRRPLWTSALAVGAKRGNQRLQPMRKQRRRFVGWGFRYIMSVCRWAHDCWRLVPVGYWNGRQEKFVRYECRDRWKVDSNENGEFD
jgi:hypothetical protein